MTHKSKTLLLRILDGHVSVDGKERRDVELIRKMVQDHSDILSRACPPGHITGSALIIHGRHGTALLHYHKSLKKWLQVGGHVDPEETDPAETALREALEESGLTNLSFFPPTDSPRPADIDVHTIPPRKGEPEHLHLDFRYIMTTEDSWQASLGTDESNQFRWLSFDQLLQMKEEVGPDLLRLVAKAKNLWEQYAAIE